jgi:response regulator of citrate/malate metabolism
VRGGCGPEGAQEFSVYKRQGEVSCSLKEHTARSFANEYRISSVSARRYLNRLVKEGKAMSEQKPLKVNHHGKEVETKKTVTTYMLK